ncbi:MAG: TonB-dependent receptor [Arcicella sp.]|nr:TonB-dependent receptor [Arcicella sp.]
MKNLLKTLLFTLISLSTFAQKVTLSGYVHEQGSKESLSNVSVMIPTLKVGTQTNNYGFFSLTIPSSTEVEITFSSLGYQVQKRTIKATENQRIEVEISVKSTDLKEVIVSSERQERVSENEQMSTVSLSINQIKDIPAILGEKDVMKALQLMPGVQKGREGTTGLYVRGGGPDQNLLILDDAVVYNANHLFGFFSPFNGDALKSVEMIKGGFPARFGGRLSSVVEMQMKEGNKEKFHGEAGIGLLSSRLTLEGPLKNGVSSYLFSARRSYADFVMKPLLKDAPSLYFYDLNMKVNYDLGQKNKIYLSGYFGRDVFDFEENSKSRSTTGSSGFNWGNATTTLRWNHLFNEKLFNNTSLIFTNYNFQVYNEQSSDKGDYSLRYSSGIRDFTFKTDFDYLPNTQHSIRAGIMATAHRFTPTAVVLTDTRIDTSGTNINYTDALETAIYAEDVWRLNDKLSMNFGLRLSNFNVNGKSYFNLEPRFSGAYRINNDLAIKASYARMNQYIHLLSNSGLGLPTDLWVPTTERIAPQTSEQIAIGIAKDFTDKNLSFTLEGYYKKMNNIIGYKEGASFILLDLGPDAKKTSEVDWQDNVTSGQGKAYGIEMMLQRKTGRLTGWVGYTLSWIKHQFDEINGGREFAPKFDRRHDLSIVTTYKLKPKITLSATFVYGTGNNLTIPIASSEGRGFSNGLNQFSPKVQYYGEFNSFQAAAYHRLDLGIKFHKQKKRGERTWEIGVFNAYNRINPFYYQSQQGYDFATQQNTDSKLYRKGLFPIVPSVTYNFKF